MEVSKGQLRHIMLYELKKGKSAAKATQNIHSAYGEECLNERICRRWFTNFRSGNFSLENEDQTGHPVEFQLKNWELSFVPTIKLFIIFNNLESFLNLQNGCIMNCLKPTANPKLTAALLFILMNSSLLFFG